MNSQKKTNWLHYIPVLLLAAPSAFPQNSVSVGNVPGFPGTTVPVPVSLRQRGGSAVAAQFDVAFNSGKVSALEALRGERLTNHVIRSRQIAPGVERVLIYSLAGAAMGGTNVAMANIPFRIAPTEFIGSGPLKPGNVVLAGSDGAQLGEASLSTGAIFVRSVNPLPDGQVQLFLQSTQDQRYAIQVTTNLVDWTNFSTNTATGNFMNLLDSEASGSPFRFYRWRLLPP